MIGTNDNTVADQDNTRRRGIEKSLKLRIGDEMFKFKLVPGNALEDAGCPRDFSQFVTTFLLWNVQIQIILGDSPERHRQRLQRRKNL